jgi:hypothetical protein
MLADFQFRIDSRYDREKQAIIIPKSLQFA